MTLKRVVLSGLGLSIIGLFVLLGGMLLSSHTASTGGTMIDAGKNGNRHPGRGLFLVWWSRIWKKCRA